eukprot:gene18557-855_t
MRRAEDASAFDLPVDRRRVDTSSNRIRLWCESVEPTPDWTSTSLRNRTPGSPSKWNSSYHEDASQALIGCTFKRTSRSPGEGAERKYERNNPPHWDASVICSDRYGQEEGVSMSSGDQAESCQTLSPRPEYRSTNIRDLTGVVDRCGEEEAHTQESDNLSSKDLAESCQTLSPRKAEPQNISFAEAMLDGPGVSASIKDPYTVADLAASPSTSCMEAPLGAVAALPSTPVHATDAITNNSFSPNNSSFGLYRDDSMSVDPFPKEMSPEAHLRDIIAPPSSSFLDQIFDCNSILSPLDTDLQRRNRRRLAVAKLLVNKGAVVDHVGDKEWSPLMVAAYKGHQGIVEYLLKQGATVDLCRRDGWTAL